VWIGEKAEREIAWEEVRTRNLQQLQKAAHRKGKGGVPGITIKQKWGEVEKIAGLPISIANGANQKHKRGFGT